MVKCIDCANLESKADYPRLPRSWMDTANKHIRDSFRVNEWFYCKAKKKPIHKDFPVYEDRECSDFVARAGFEPA